MTSWASESGFSFKRSSSHPDQTIAFNTNELLKAKVTLRDHFFLNGETILKDKEQKC